VSIVTQPTHQVTEKKSNRTGSVLTAVILIAAIAASFAYFQMKPAEKKTPKKPEAPVTVAIAQRANIPVEIKSIGAVVPMNAVSVKSRVGGRIVKISFKEGETVKKKDLLFTVDPRPLKAEYSIRESEVLKQEAVIAQAKAAIEKGKAALEQVKANLARDLALARLAGNRSAVHCCHCQRRQSKHRQRQSSDSRRPGQFAKRSGATGINQSGAGKRARAAQLHDG